MVNEIWKRKIWLAGLRGVICFSVAGGTLSAAVNVEINTDETYTQSTELGVNVFIAYGDSQSSGATGSVTVSNAGVVVNSQATTQIGILSLDQGSLNVRQGAEYISGLELYVGEDGHGIVTLESGGKLNTSGYSTRIGDNYPGIGEVTVSGANSTLTTGSLIAGIEGKGTLTLADGGTAVIANGTGELSLAANSPSTGTLNIGNGGKAGKLQALTINGGQGTANVVFNHTDDVTFLPRLTGKLNLIKKGTGTLSLPTHNTFSGTTSVDGGELSLFPGFTLTQTDASVGTSTGDSGSVKISQAGSLWKSTGQLVVGNAGKGVVTADLGASLESATAVVGQQNGSDGKVTLTGAGTQWKMTGELIVAGASGAKGAILLQAGAAMNTLRAGIGTVAGADALVTVKGTGTRWTNSSYLRVGGSGKIEMLSGGALETDWASVGQGSSGTAQVDVSGNGSLWQTQRAYVGDQSNGLLNLSGGGAVTANEFRVGNTGLGTVNISEAGSQLSVAGEFIIGYSGQAAMNVTGGGTLASKAAIIAHETTSTAAITVSGQSSVWSLTGQSINLGRRGNGSLTVNNGGVVNTGYAVLGEQGPGRGSASVSGSGSELNFLDITRVGKQGQGSIEVASGGSARTSILWVGDEAGSSGDVVVKGQDSKFSVTQGGAFFGWHSSGSLTVSDHGAFSALIVQVGGESGGNGTLTVASGGTVSSSPSFDRIEVARNASSTGVINIGSYDLTSTAGTLLVSKLVFGPGAGTINFNQTDDIVFAPKIEGNAKVVMRGSGKTTFQDGNTYTGDTWIEEGFLMIDGDQSQASGAVRVSDGGVLGGTGVVGGETFIELGGALDLDSDDLDFAAGLKLESGGAIHFQMGDAGAQVAGLLALENNVTLLLEAALQTEGRYALFYYDQVEGLDNLETWNVSGGSAGYTYSFGGEDGQIYLQATAIPEPRGLAVAGLILGWLWMRRRKESQVAL